MIEHLYNEFYKELTAWGLSLTNNSTLTEDLVQETYIRAMGNMSLLETLELKQQRAWMYRTMKNLYIDYVRKSKFETPGTETIEFQQDESPYDEIDCCQMLLLLPEEERELFIMRYIQGYNSKEISEILGLPPGTVRFKLSEARKHLRELWD